MQPVNTIGMFLTVKPIAYLAKLWKMKTINKDVI